MWNFYQSLVVLIKTQIHSLWYLWSQLNQISHGCSTNWYFKGSLWEGLSEYPLDYIYFKSHQKVEKGTTVYHAQSNNFNILILCWKISPPPPPIQKLEKPLRQRHLWPHILAARNARPEELTPVYGLYLSCALYTTKNVQLHIGRQ